MESVLRMLEVPGAMLLGGSIGWWVSRRGNWAWLAVYSVGLALLGIYIALARFPVFAIHVLPPSVVASPHRFPIAAMAIVLVLVPIGTRLRDVGQRRRLVALLGAMGLVVGGIPAVSAQRAIPELTRLPDGWFADGVCRQQTDYTCGPAAAATGLRLLGIRTTEGELGLLAGTSPAEGTPATVLAAVLSQRFAGDGLHVELRRFRDIESLRKAGLVLVEVHLAPLVNHWICVREVTESHVVVGDPTVGWQALTHADFLAGWWRTGVVLVR